MWVSLISLVARALGIVDLLEEAVRHARDLQQGIDKQKAADVAAAQKEDQSARAIDDSNRRLSNDDLAGKLRDR